jgi:hypothetical protein
MARLADEEQRERMGKAARQRAETVYAMEPFVMAYERLYQEAIAAFSSRGQA